MTEHMQAFMEGTLGRIARENSLAALRPEETKALYERCIREE